MLQGVVAGNLGQDAELKAMPSGGSVCNFSVASSRKDKGKEVTTWVRCAIFGKRAEAIAQYLTKGTKVTVVGELSVREYQTRDGRNGVSVEIKASEVALMGGGKGRGAPATGSGAAPSGGGGQDEQDYGGAEDDIPF